MNKLTKRRWLLVIISVVMITLIICNLLTFIIDPLFQYRVRDNNQYILNPSYSASGLIKNYTYDTIIIGSSMTQNFDMDLFRTKTDSSPLHIGIGGMTYKELAEYTLLANDAGKAEDYYLCIDLATFRENKESRVIDYLKNSDGLSRLQYGISYESIFRFMPIDMCFLLITKMGYLPKSFEEKMDINRLGYWGDEYSYGEDVVLAGLKTRIDSVSEVDTTDLYKKMIVGIDSFFSQLDLGNANYNFFFPPYSALFWCEAQEDEYFDIYLDAKEYFVSKAIEYGATVYDFQSASFITDLDNYKDTTHYAPEINDWMIECFSKKNYIITPENHHEYREQLVNKTNEFRHKYDYLFE